MILNLKFFLQKELLLFGSVFSVLRTLNTLPPQFFPAPGKILNEIFGFQIQKSLSINGRITK